MELSNKKLLKKIGKRVAYLMVIFDKNRPTAFCVHVFWKWEIFHININLLEIEKNISNLVKRGYSPDYITLQALLHEIAHYKKYTRFRKYKRPLQQYDNYCNDCRQFVEKVADRYARIYYRRFV